VWPDVDSACATAVHVTGSTTPNAADVTRYEAVYAQYRALYPALKSTFAGLAQL
jgi:xylulokinase